MWLLELKSSLEYVKHVLVGQYWDHPWWCSGAALESSQGLFPVVLENVGIHPPPPPSAQLSFWPSGKYSEFTNRGNRIDLREGK